MTIEKKDLEDMRLSRPVSITDLWEIDDRVDRLEDITNRLEKIVEALAELYLKERAKTWELILKEMVEKELQKKNESRFRKSI